MQVSVRVSAVVRKRLPSIVIEVTLGAVYVCVGGEGQDERERGERKREREKARER